ncbi:MAG: F0F1 ATP synthase subunit delta [Pseudomonadales bacterium]|jgi:F-type H+-transporting ATPase subunit delta|nr:F0F1 ATP synthase subunit delta [Pseudomonadales bacterium]
MSQLTTFARPYAKAAFETAEAAGALTEWSQALGLAAALTQEEKVATFLNQPELGWERQAATLLELADSGLDGKQRNFISLLASNQRLALLPETVRLYEELKAERERTVDVEVVSAFALDEEQTQALAGTLKTRLRREVKLSASVDQSLIGGVIVRAGDLVIDASVRGKLNKLSETMNA